MSERIDHAAYAQAHIEEARRQYQRGLSGDVLFAQLAQAEATLALVEQQRIANLIALSVTAPPYNEGPNVQALQALLGEPVKKERWFPGSSAPHMENIYYLRPDIAAALGIKEEK